MPASPGAFQLLLKIYKKIRWDPTIRECMSPEFVHGVDHTVSTAGLTTNRKIYIKKLSF